MTLDQLRCFAALIETRSFRAAAERVHRSQPAVSQRLKALEAQFGQPLLERKTCRPTPLGKLIHKRAQKMILDAESLQREATDFDHSAHQELRVGTSDTTALYTLPARIRKFAQQMPQTRLVLVNRGSQAIAEQVLQGELDLGIITLPQNHPHLIEEPLFRQAFVLVLPHSHPLAQEESITLPQLKNEPFLLLEEQTRTGALLRKYFEKRNFTPQILLDSGSFEVIKRYITEGVGVSFLPEAVLTPKDKKLHHAHIPGLPKFTIGAIWRQGAYQSKPERAFLELLRTDT